VSQEKKMYKVTIHEHKIYDSFIQAFSEADAEELAEDQIINEENFTWREDFNAGWIEVGDITEEDDIDAELV